MVVVVVVLLVVMLAAEQKQQRLVQVDSPVAALCLALPLLFFSTFSHSSFVSTLLFSPLSSLLLSVFVLRGAQTSTSRGRRQLVVVKERREEGEGMKSLTRVENNP